MRASRTRHWPWIAVVLVAVAGAGGSLAYGRGADDKPVASDTGVVGKPVTREGIFQYTVNAVDCTTTCTVRITIKNLSGKTRKPGIAFARAFDPDGAGHLSDAVAEVQRGTHLLDDLPPRSELTDNLYYAMPEIRYLELRETAESAGITIQF
ncbi:hypothetical protein [Paractinoplanes lichenicola]|uniref:DUF4352 domain-containing protein n=1 Tax=Paractinoplanes lichenicola TaxID=2802976 RepID=A0ABS1VYF7_9ACTN|nr:hypothetical protein [Actinoplanes lichenicola]MBL7259523.1 hypothetical protein [Actinoplanes lichenicola]